MSEYFPEPKSLGERLKVELDLPNYVTKVDLKNATGINTSKFAKKHDLLNLKSNVDKLDIDKLVHVSLDLSKLSDVVKNDVVKKEEYNAKIKNVEDNILDITDLATYASLHTEINEV